MGESNAEFPASRYPPPRRILSVNLRVSLRLDLKTQSPRSVAVQWQGLRKAK